MTTGSPSEDVNRLSQELEKIFTEYVTVDADGVYRVDEKAVGAAGKIGEIDAYRGYAALLNLNSPTSQPYTPGRMRSPSYSAMGAEEFAKCTIGNAIGIGILNTPGLVKATVTAIKAWNWGLAAKTVLRIAGPIALKGAGGVPGLAAQLGVAAWSCRGKL